MIEVQKSARTVQIVHHTPRLFMSPQEDVRRPIFPLDTARPRYGWNQLRSIASQLENQGRTHGVGVAQKIQELCLQ